MPPTAPIAPVTLLPVPDIEIDEPVAVIPMASVAPLEGPADGERIHTFALATRNDDWAGEDFTVHAYGEVRDRVLSKPLTYVAAAFSLGYLLSRALR